MMLVWLGLGHGWTGRSTVVRSGDGDGPKERMEAGDFYTYSTGTLAISQV